MAYKLTDDQLQELIRRAEEKGLSEEDQMSILWIRNKLNNIPETAHDMYYVYYKEDVSLLLRLLLGSEMGDVSKSIGGNLK